MISNVESHDDSFIGYKSNRFQCLVIGVDVAKQTIDMPM